MIVEWPQRRPAVLAVVGKSGTGKTTLLCALLPRLHAAGLRGGVVKHSHHELEVDRPGKDSYRLRKAGAEQALLVSQEGWSLMADDPGPRAGLDEAIERFAGDLDLVLVEGYRHADCPKLELIRLPLDSPPLYLTDPGVIAVATDRPLAEPAQVPVLRLDDVAAITDLVAGLVNRTADLAAAPSAASAYQAVRS